MSEFDVNALYEAVDAQRRERGLSWQQLAREVNRGEGTGHPIAASTIRGMREKRYGLEGDSVLQVLVWLGRTPESFVPDGSDGAPLPVVPADRVLRWDTVALHAALDSERERRAITWQQVAREVGASASGLSRLHTRSPDWALAWERFTKSTGGWVQTTRCVLPGRVRCT